MNRNKPLIELVELIARRSICQIQVGALIYDSSGRTLSWGWNHAGNHGLGCHAEDFAIKRANKRRLEGSTIMVYSIRRKRNIISFPCPSCYKMIRAAKIKFVECNNSNREWMRYKI